MKKEVATWLVVNVSVWLLAALGFCWRWWYGLIGVVLALLFTLMSLAAIVEVAETKRRFPK